jgi:ketosteroid isomerase-like protein
MAMLDDNIISRPDPARQMAYGPAAQCASYPFTRMANSFVRLEEMYAVGGPLDTLVLFKRADLNGPAGGRGGFGGFNVDVAVLVRVRNGRITEWLDAPINRIGGLVTAAEPLAQPPGGATVPDACKKYSVAGRAPAPAQTPAQSRQAGQILTYGTAKPERYWNVEETQAAQAVRAWFAARQAGDPLLLGAFVDQNVVFRADEGAAKLVKGRAALLRAVCGTFGGQQRLTQLYPIGSDFDTLVLTESINSQGTRTASFFRVQKNLITEWMDVVVEAAGPAAAANPNSTACQAVNTALAR